MSAKDRILAGALALGEFTIPELVRYTQAKENTVYTVLDRYKSLFDKSVDESAPRKRGGRPNRYRLPLNKAHELRQQLDYALGPKNQPAKDNSNDLTVATAAAVHELLKSLDGKYGGLESIHERAAKRGLLALRNLRTLFQLASDKIANDDPDEIERLELFVNIAESLAKFVRLYARHKLAGGQLPIAERDQIQAAQSALSRILLHAYGPSMVDPLVQNLANTISKSKACQMDIQREFPAELVIESEAWNIGDQDRRRRTPDSPATGSSSFVQFMTMFGLTILQPKYDAEEVSLVSTSEPDAPALRVASTAGLSNKTLVDLSMLMEKLPAPNVGAFSQALAL